MIFPNNDIKGGIMYLTYDKKYEGKTDITVVDNKDEQYHYKGFLNSANTDVFIPYPELVSIYSKVSDHANLKSESIQDIISTRKPFGLTTDFLNTPEKFTSESVLDDQTE